MADSLLRHAAPMRLLVIALALLAPLAATAQAIEIQVQQRESVSVGAGSCNAPIPINYTVTIATTPCAEFKIWLSEADCGDAPATGETTIRTVAPAELATTPSGNFTIAVDELPVFVGDGGQTCGTAGLERTWKVCASFKIQDQFTFQCTSVVKESSPPTIHYDSIAPGTPSITSVEPLDTALSVGLGVDDETAAVTVTVRLPGTADVVTSASEAKPIGVVRIPGLTNGTQYELVAQATDEAGNLSGISEPAYGTPVAIAGFGRIYKDMGGKETGGCSAIGATTAGIWGLVFGTWFLWRRRSWR